MADPITLTAITLGAAAGSAVLGAVGAKESAEASANMYNYKAGVAQVNEQIQKQNADYARATGEVQAQEVGLANRFKIGTMKVAQAAGNLDVNSGSTADVRKSQSDIGQQDQAVVRANAAKRAYGFDIEALSAKTSGQMDLMSAEQSEKEGTVKAIGSLLGGASSVSSKWLQAKQVGIGSSSSVGSGSGYSFWGD